jgi:acyl-CoA synthetase (AMP-forming)/AMP-acid ligase II
MAGAVMRLGLVPFCISPRDAAASLANLLAQTGAVAVYVSSDNMMQSVLSEALAISGKTLPVFDALTFEQLQDKLFALPVPVIPSVPMDSTAIILHLSDKVYFCTLSTVKLTSPSYRLNIHILSTRL